MAVNALTVRMKFRNYDEKKLLTVVNNPDSTEVEVKVATDLLKKKGVDLSEQASEPIKKSVPKKKQEVVEEGETPEEEARLEKAEKEFDARQKNRKTPSRVDRKMAKEHSNKKDEPRQTKRQNIDESEEMPGMKVGVKVTLKEGTDVGEIVRLYRSGDGKEKCMVKFGDEKPIKKRVTALKLYEEPAGKAAPKKTTKKK
jgi:hypothetical protein